MVRKIVQISATLAQNGYLQGFITGNLYRGPFKGVCVPGLNCYSCPSAFGACPIGSMQALASSARIGISLYVYGFLALIGIAAGRFVCGFLCPFGLMQELLHKIPVKKIREWKAFKILSKAKYAVLAVFVIGIPTAMTLTGAISFPAFCQWICPAGTLQAGIPLVLLDSRIAGAVGLLFVWKVAVLLLVVIASIVLYRPFCRFLCPLGALYSLFNRISVIQIRTDETLCGKCGSCKSGCPINADSPDSTDCIRCGACARKCPAKAMRWRVRRPGAPSLPGHAAKPDQAARSAALEPSPCHIPSRK